MRPSRRSTIVCLMVCNLPVTVDVIGRSTPDIMLDDEMLDRAVTREYYGRRLTLVPPEDLIVMKALAASEDTPRYWYDALGVIGHTDLDYDYLIRRARASGSRRVLSLLLYAWSNDLVVPNRVNICQAGRTVTVPKAAVEARLRRGDTLGRCS